MHLHFPAPFSLLNSETRLTRQWNQQNANATVHVDIQETQTLLVHPNIFTTSRDKRQETRDKRQTETETETRDTQ